jgi:hypothetical protein
MSGLGEAGGKHSETAADPAFRNLVGEALALCHAADPQLGGELARVLEIEHPAVPVGHALQPAVALRTCLRMLTYAQVEASERTELFHWTGRLDLCIEQIVDRLDWCQAGSHARPRLHS